LVIVPDLEIERTLWHNGKRRVAGVDEVGVGPLAGPVLAAACVLPPDCSPLEGVRDSKTLTAAGRERLLRLVLDQVVAVGIGAASVREIEASNILAASRLAMRRALASIGDFDHVLVDGRPIRGWDLGPYTPVVDGDATVYSIACASIVAKVTRDRLMCRLAARYPGYGWDHNSGYATRAHLEALRILGPTPYHRRLFAPVRAICEPGLFPHA
jgi:ribonuclease HII